MRRHPGPGHRQVGEKLSSVRQGHENLVETSYPQMNWSEYEESGAVDTALETKWELTDAEHAGLVEIAGDAGVITGRQVMIIKDYSNKVHWTVPLHDGRAVEHWSGRASTDSLI